MSQQRILIVITDGIFAGANQTNDEGSPEPLDLVALQEAIGDSLLNTVTGLESELAATKASLEGMETYKAEMTAKVSSALQSGDPAQFQALAVEFLTPAQELARLEKIAKIAELEAEAAKLKAEIAP